MRKYIAVILLFALPLPVLASRVVNISVELDGKTILDGDNGDDGFAGPPIVWRYLKNSPLHPANGFAMPVEPGDPSVAVLKGRIVVRVQYGADAQATELRLTRAPRSGWLIDPVWIEANRPPGDTGEAEQKLAARRGEHQRERDIYRWGSLAAAGFAVASWLACLTALVASFKGRRQSLLTRACVADLAGGVAVVLRFIGSPYFPDDERAYDLRTYAMYAGAVSCVFAGFVWWLGRRPPRAAEPGATPDRQGGTP